MKDVFSSTVETLNSLGTKDEQFLVFCSGEQTDFCRFNESRVRQVGAVNQQFIELRLISRGRQASASFSMTGDKETNARLLAEKASHLRNVVENLEEDPYLLYATSLQSSDDDESDDNEFQSADRMVDDIVSEGDGVDLVGYLSCGRIYHGFANSLGQSNWFAGASFNFDWSLFTRENQAVKCSYAGRSWDREVYRTKLEDARKHLEILSRTPRDIKPGQYRIYLAPSAMVEIFSLLSWNGFGKKAVESKQSPLYRLYDGEYTLSEKFSVCENAQGGIAPMFDEFGFIKPPKTDLIKNGQSAGSLISARSAKEFECEPNGASMEESPDSLDLAAGDIPQEDILRLLDTGLYVSNLWYLNYSDRRSCKMTGMTRFASFWVENGQIVAPIGAMRFDDSFIRMFGDGLIGLTKEREFLLSSSSYNERSVDSQRMPGALINDFNLTL